MTESFDSWAILEIMGHQKYAGRVTEQAVGGAAFVRVDIPATDGQPAFTKLFGGASIFCITPVTEEVARAVAARCTTPPVQPYELPDLRASDTVHRLPEPVSEEPPFDDRVVGYADLVDDDADYED